MEFWRAGTVVVLFVFVMLLFFFSISFVCIELCLRIDRRDLQKIAPICKICYYLIL